MARVICVTNQKGGVGKTTSAINISSYIADSGKKVLLVDLDPQGNATSGLGFDPRQIKQGIYQAIVGKTFVSNIVIHTKEKGLDLAPATQDLAGANIELVNVAGREFVLAEALNDVRSKYDYIFIDSPPSLGILTINGLVAADEVIIPVQCEYYALEGLGQLLKTIELIRKSLKPDLIISGAVLTMFDRRTKISNDVVREVQKRFPARVYDAVIPRSVRLTESPSFGKSIRTYEPWSKGARAYKRLAKEIITENI
jgi:chromosome partitioning protein